ncbi:hypothetical protein DAPPUDRAFT_120938 [Daphnia pulex]|uniref:Uncharacterized protein n=1 Tax=Daphnia pulex TaxID=6669 RepID=E9I2H8_DAPPU|nr:hypothetical protein DAPPUDRAFT_120938 [Daphnia pulex]|eukprot:EFX61802.1 hypothetical protein DAPPUDRAFT_120938 [Daphnia pulex]
MTCYVTAIHQLDAEKGKVNDMEAAEPVALPCVTTEDMFQEPTTETLLHIPPEKELQSESESQLRVEFEPNDIEAAEPVALPCVTPEDMFQEPTSDTLLHIPPEKELQSESESQLRVEFEPNDMEVDELIGAPGEMTEEMLQENSEQTARETGMEGYLDPVNWMISKHEITGCIDDESISILVYVYSNPLPTGSALEKYSVRKALKLPDPPSVCDVTIHALVVFKTDDFATCKEMWWSLEKNRHYIVLQHSPDQADVVDKIYDIVTKKISQTTGTGE